MPKSTLPFLFTLAFSVLLAGCNQSVQSSAPPSDSRLKVILDTDLGNDIDDIMCVDLLYKYQDMGKIDFLAIMLNKEGRYAARYADILNTWYGHPETPIGVIQDGAECYNEGAYYSKKTCLMKDENGQPLFPGSLTDYYRLPGAVDLYRQILSKASDASIDIVSVGFSTNLSRLLDSAPDAISPLSGKELVARKVRRLTTMAGNIRDSLYSEYNVVVDVPAAQNVFHNWPGLIVTSPFELGMSVLYPYASIERDFLWAEHNPAIEGYKNYRQMPYDSPMWDPTAALYAVDNDGYFQESEPGFIRVLDGGQTLFTPSKDGNRRYLTISQDQIERTRNHFVEVFSSKPLCYR